MLVGIDLPPNRGVSLWSQSSTAQYFGGGGFFFGKVWPNLFFGRFGQALFQFDSASYWGSDPSQKKQIPKLLPDPFPKGLLQIKTPKIAISPIACCKHTTLEMWVC